MMHELEKEGFRIVPSGNETGLFIVNTCTVTHTADKKNLQMVRHLRKLYAGKKILAIGCHSQLAPDTYASICEGIAGNGEKNDIVSCVKQLLDSPSLKRVNRSYWLNENLQCRLEGRFELTRAFVMIQDGCNVGCSYCKIYHARGTRIRSKSYEDVYKEVRDFEIAGYREIVLIGINLGKYHDGFLFLPELCEKLLNDFPDLRFRLSSINPDDFSPELLSLWNYPNLCHHLHISIQSGSASILAKMRRPYDPQTVYQGVYALKQLDPLFSITADIIVGFPGESEQDFKDTCEMVRKIEPLKVHIFRFSRRKNTPAYFMEDMLDETGKKRRSRYLYEIAKECSLEFRSKHIRKERSMIIEKQDPQKANWIGHDGYYIQHAILLNGNAMKESLHSGQQVIVNPLLCDKEQLDRMVSEIVRIP
jgi:threonylcarbamoyladenosine tRNA methylthiotransferase MtaB